MTGLLFPGFGVAFLVVWLGYLGALCWRAHRARRQAEAHRAMEPALRGIVDEAEHSWLPAAAEVEQMPMAREARSIAEV